MKWPDYPIVDVIDNKIVIFYENGSKLVWGIEEEYNRMEVVNDIKNGLKAIEFLQCSMGNIIEACFMILSEKGLSKELRNEYLNEAFQELLSKRTNKETPNDNTTLFYLR